MKQYPVTGRVIGTNSESGEVELDAKAIPGFMDAMTMPYRLKDPAMLSTLHRGDELTGVLHIGGKAGTVLDQVKVTDASKELRDPTPQNLMKKPTVGEAVPNFTLLDQSGHTLHIADLRGKLVLLTFVYTRCPLADYCPRMSHNFADIDKALAADPAAYNGTHLLTVSFDPERDTPAVLRSYGGAYTGRYTNETFTHWSFAAPRAADLQPMLEFFAVGAAPGQKGTLTHSLSTAEIGPDGRLLKWYGGNDWTAPELLGEVHKALGAGA